MLLNPKRRYWWELQCTLHKQFRKNLGTDLAVADRTCKSFTVKEVSCTNQTILISLAGVPYNFAPHWQIYTCTSCCSTTQKLKLPV
jgi:hypothetical protein